MNQQAIPPTLPERGKFSSSVTTAGSSTIASSRQTVSAAPSQPQHVFTASGLATKKTSPAPIYKWEGNNGKSERSEIVIGEKTFVPSNYNAIYTASGKSKDMGDELLSQEFVDFQIILNKEEMEVLAARRKKLHLTSTASAQNLSSINGVDKAIHKSHVASMSLSKSTPYVDSRRIQSELLIRR